MSANASEMYIKLDKTFNIVIDYSIDTPALSVSVDNYFYKNSINSIDYRSYAILNDLQRIIYDRVVAGEVGELNFHFDFEYGEFPASSFTEDFFDELMNAIALDNPQLFYIGGLGVSNAYGYSGQKYIAKFDCIFSISSNSTYTQSDLSTKHIELMNAVANIDFDLSNRYNFVKSVHDYLCEIGTYPDLNSPDYTGNCHDAYGCLIEEKPVCQGYADAFKLICDYYKIPCVCIGGPGYTSSGSGPHMWNAVQMDDGKWYLVDITWDDQDSYGTFYDFFLSGTDTKASYSFSYGVFKEKHVNNEKIYLPTLDYSTEKYNETNHNTLFKATYNSLAKEDGNYLIRSFFDAGESCVYYNGMYVETNNLTTNDRFKVFNNENNVEEDWTLVLLGDCNGDGECNALDYSAAVNNIIADDETTDAYDWAMDIDCDGYLDVFDLAMMQLLVNGFTEDIEIE